MARDRVKMRRYYEFCTIGHDLDESQIAALDQYAKRKGVGSDSYTTATSFTGDYTRDTDPMYDDAALMRRYGFDAHLFFRTSGERKLVLKVSGLGLAEVKPYLCGRYDGTTAKRTQDGVLVSMKYYEEDGELAHCKDNPEKWLDLILPVRDMLVAGDLSPLYVAWKAWQSVSDDGEVRNRPSPPVPAQMPDRLPPPLSALRRFLRGQSVK
ncbi:hypothetical protein [Streptomyces lunaelactis]|uniref:hypothetical protein n=1 Tax=Streptomyces lunaelactis TaxID=1535768 RepID=UPI001584650D|nr:hypothetical protein [Streptomyces lunaelactis]NUK14066.1 hypothetical protein [Streptomyces lunaelactis]